MQSEILENLKRCGDIQPGEKIVVAVSGGADSVFLLHLLKKLPFQLIVAHFNHKLRENAGLDANFTKSLCAELQVPFEEGQGDVREFSKSTKTTIEEAARILRYRFLVSVAVDHQAEYIAVAHNANDQVETVLMHLLRGTGLSGLTGMKYGIVIEEFHPSIKIIRPILSIWRRQIEDYLHANSLAYRLDETNSDQNYSRNKIRHRILPFLVSEYPTISTRLFQTAEVLRTDLELVDEVVSKKWQTHADIRNQGVVSFQRNEFLIENIAVQRHLLRRSVFFLQPNTRDISFTSIERVREAIAKHSAGQFDLEDNLLMELFNNRIIISAKNFHWQRFFFPQMSDVTITINQTGTYLLGENWEILVTLQSAILDKDALKTQSEMIAELDFEVVGGFPLIIRPWKKGDRMMPLGMEGDTISIGNYFTNQKIPRGARSNWPILLNFHGKIGWVCGLRLAHPFRITDKTEKIIRLELNQKNMNG